jgi:hypothetical protein
VTAQPDLFPVEPTLSPRLRWMKLNDVRTHEAAFITEMPWCAWLPDNDTPGEFSRPIPLRPDHCGYGKTEQAAVEELADVLGVVNWENDAAQPPPLC